ncbi:hypothetical protein P9112_008402 [Eukaryota sp. TZLM1-RC]
MSHIPSTFTDTSNSLLKKYSIDTIIGKYGFCNLILIASATQKATNTPCSLLIFDKRPFSRKQLKQIIPFITKDFSFISTHRHFSFIKAFSHHTESRHSIILPIERVVGSLNSFDGHLCRIEYLLGLASLIQGLIHLDKINKFHLAVDVDNIFISADFSFKLGNFSFLNDEITENSVFDLSYSTINNIYPFPPLDSLPPEMTSSAQNATSSVTSSWQIGVLLAHVLPNFVNLTPFPSLSVQLEGLESCQCNVMLYNQYASRLSSIGQVCKSLSNSDPLFEILSRCFERDYRKRIDLSEILEFSCFKSGRIQLLLRLRHYFDSSDTSQLNSDLSELFSIFRNFDEKFIRRGLCSLIVELMYKYGYQEIKSKKKLKKKKKKSPLEQYQNAEITDHTVYLLSLCLSLADFLDISEFSEHVLPCLLQLVVTLTREELTESNHKILAEFLCKRCSLLIEGLKLYDAELLSTLFFPFLFKVLTIGQLSVIQFLFEMVSFLPNSLIVSQLVPNLVDLIHHNLNFDVKSASLLLLTKLNCLDQCNLKESIIPSLMNLCNDDLPNHLIVSLIVTIDTICQNFHIDKVFIGHCCLPPLLKAFSTTNLTQKQAETCANVFSSMVKSLLDHKKATSLPSTDSLVHTTEGKHSSVIDDVDNSDDVINHTMDDGDEGCNQTVSDFNLCDANASLFDLDDDDFFK